MLMAGVKVLAAAVLKHIGVADCYLTNDLETVNNELLELQETDDNAEGERQAARLKRGTKSRRSATAAPELELETEVEYFVKGRAEIIKKWKAESDSVILALKKYDAEERRRFEECMAQEELKQDARAAQSLAMMAMTAKGWSQDQFETYSPDHIFSSDLTSPLTDDEWLAMSSKVVEKLEAHYAREHVRVEAERLRKAKKARKNAIRPFYDALLLQQTKMETFPPFSDFLTLSDVKSFWNSADATVTSASWGLSPSPKSSKASVATAGELESPPSKPSSFPPDPSPPLSTKTSRTTTKASTPRSFIASLPSSWRTTPSGPTPLSSRTKRATSEAARLLSMSRSST